MIGRTLGTLLVSWVLAGVAWGQGMEIASQADLTTRNNIPRNSVGNMHAMGDTVWIGPFMSFTTDGGATWFDIDADSIANGNGRMFSIDSDGSTIWAGLGYSQKTGEAAAAAFIPTAVGFVFSEDAGATWEYRFPPLDIASDTTINYGVSTLPALAVIVPQQSPPYDIDYDAATGTVWTAGWASGIRKSVDKGLTWQRVVLPPDTLEEIRPDVPYNFRYEPARNELSKYSFNFLGFAVHVDSDGNVWTGSAHGINLSRDGGESWRNFSFTGTQDRPLGNFVTAIEEQKTADGNAVWFATWRADSPLEEFGILATKDGGETFEQFLLGERIYDFAFNGETVYAAGENGLFISDDSGRSWRLINYFTDDSQVDRVIRRDVNVFSVVRTSTDLWVGTNDGLLKSNDEGASWRLFRSEVPVNTDTPSDDVPDVDSFVYPNPFSPSSDAIARIRYELASASGVTIRIFDFGMSLVRDLVNGDRSAGTREDTWDGKDNRGIVVANGVYFYTISTGEGFHKGKILVVE